MSRILSITVFLLSSLHASLALKLKIEHRECFTYELTAYDAFYGTFVSMPDVYGYTAAYDLLVHAPSGTKVYEVSASHDGRFSLVPYENGQYKFCLSMVPDAHASRHVLERDLNFDLHIAVGEHHHDTMKEHETDQLWTHISQISQQISQMKSLHQWMYWRDKAHRLTIDSTNSRIFWYAILRNATLVSVCIFQVIFICRIFFRAK